MRPLWTSCIALWASCIIFPAAADTKPLTRAEPIVRLVLQESNNEPFYGMVAVAGTVIDRAEDSRWPNTVGGVAYQGNHTLRTAQYSGMAIPFKKYTKAQIQLARAAVEVARLGVRPCGRVLWFHTPWVSPGWAKRLDKSCRIGGHIFYTDKTETNNG